MDNLDIQVGDRVTYENGFVEIMLNNQLVKQRIDSDRVIKIERIGAGGWYTVYEKKELLTDEEREFLKDIIKYYDNISQIDFTLSSISFENDNFNVICNVDYPKKLKFENIKKNKYYTLKDLGLEEEV